MTQFTENKAYGDDIHNAFADFCHAFESFKQTNDTRLNELETRKSIDVLTQDKLTRVETALDEAKSRLDRLALEKARPALSLETGRETPEFKAAFDAYMRGGDTLALSRLEMKNLNTGTSAAGGVVAPAYVETEILRRLANVSPLREICNVRTSSNGTYKLAFSTVAAATGWVGETAARPQTAGLNLAELTFPAMELYAMPAATQSLLDDAVVNVEEWLAGEVETAFAEQETAAFISGNGSTQPRGFLNQTIVNNTSWSWGNIGAVNTGVSGAFPASSPSDVLIDLVYALRGGFRQNASFIMNRRTQSAIRRFKDAQGAYLWQPPAGVGQNATFMNFPVVEAEQMPDIGAGALAIAFGDFNRGYLIVDRTGVNVLRDPYSNKPYVLFYTTKRVGGGVLDFDAIKVLRFAA